MGGAPSCPAPGTAPAGRAVGAGVAGEGHNGGVPTDDDDLIARLLGAGAHDDLGPDPTAEGPLTGRLLVATPALGEGVFHRAVVLVLHHDDEGAQGVVLDKPTPADVDRVLPGWGEHVAAPNALFHGGPVGEDSALAVVSVPGTDPEPIGVRHLFASFGLLDLDTPPPLVVPHVAGIRVFAGYSGWSAGQLEAEIGAGGWYVVDLEPGDVFTDDPQGLWRRVLRRQPGRLALVAWYPPDPELN